MSGQPQDLQRGLKNRHIQLIALGGAVGTGLFLGTASTIKMAGPSVILAYLIGGLIAFLIMRQLGEMMAQEPVAGSFSNLAFKYWGPMPGFLSGWNYWFLYILVSMSELTACAVYLQHWFPDIPQWVSITAFFILINAINLTAVRIYGEAEFWFSIIKVSAIIGMIIFGSYILLSGSAGPESRVSNLWEHGGFFPNGMHGMFISLAVVTFSFGGLELVGIAAAEAEDPQKTIPKAINQVLVRILIFYVGALIVLLALYPWNQIGIAPHDVPWEESMAASPFVKIFSNIGIPSAAHVLNFVVLTAALSVYNSGVFCNSRMLYGLALQGNAPKIFGRLSSKGVPVYSILVSSGATMFCILLNAVMPERALGILMSLVVASLVINWGMICITHMKFRAAVERQGTKLVFKSLAYPFSNIVCLLFILVIFYILWITGQETVVLVAPLWILFVCAGYWVKKALSGKAQNSH
ncbi:MAG: amino acid permease [Desulfovibrionaceae bacterium]|nr:amino acid permease [Desulfovibrionaceae bacterium]